LPLVVSAALAESVLDGNAAQTATALAATGWRDMTRLARGDASMAAGIVATNADEVARRLRDFRIVIDAWITAVEGDTGVDAVELARRFERAARLSTDVMQRDDRDA
jgi:prephenate dehydrogenase